jgi:PKD repeat protein
MQQTRFISSLILVVAGLWIFDSCKKPATEACFSYTPAAPVIGAPDTFYNCSLTTISSKWYFGDGDSDVTNINGIHTYLNPGNYNVKLLNTDSAGKVGSTTQNITVAVPAITSSNYVGTFTGSQVCTLTGTTNSSITIAANGYLGIYILNLYGISASLKGTINGLQGTIPPQIFNTGAGNMLLQGSITLSADYNTINLSLMVTSFGKTDNCQATLVK